MAITIETVPPGGRDLQRYQGLVALGEDSLAAAFEQYFAQSEQLPTRLLLAAGRDRAAGLMLQQLPGGHGDPDGWRRCCALFDTLGPEELLATGADALLHRLFHEEDLRRLDRRGLRFACSCSRARVAEVLGGLGREEALAACQEGLARIHCDFCGQEYLFSRDELVALFDRAPGNAPGSDRLQ
jgi:molecular chaperone Hsp33